MGAVIAVPIEPRASLLVPRHTPLVAPVTIPNLGLSADESSAGGDTLNAGSARPIDRRALPATSTEGAADTTSLVMCRTHALWVMSLFASGCRMAGTGHDTAYSPRPLQSNNCGTPYQFKACGSGSRVACCQTTGVGAVQRSKSLVVIEKLTGPAREAATPGSYDLMDYSRSSVPDPASLTPVLGKPTPARDN